MKIKYLFILACMLLSINTSSGLGVRMTPLKSDFSQLTRDEANYPIATDFIDKIKSISYNDGFFLDVTCEEIDFRDGIELNTVTKLFSETKLTKREIIECLKIGKGEAYKALPLNRLYSYTHFLRSRCYVFSRQNNTLEFFAIEIIKKDEKTEFTLSERMDKNIIVPSLLVAYRVRYAQIKRDNEIVIKKAEDVNTLAVFHLEGLGSFKVDEDKAFQLFHQAAQMGDASAQYNLANCYIFGRGVSQDLEKAEPWLIKASEQGFVDAIELLEWLYLKLEEDRKSGARE